MADLERILRKLIHRFKVLKEPCTEKSGVLFAFFSWVVSLKDRQLLGLSREELRKWYSANRQVLMSLAASAWPSASLNIVA